MPVTVAKRGNLYRVVEKSGRLARGRSGTPVSKGFRSKAQAVRQARAINRSLAQRP